MKLVLRFRDDIIRIVNFPTAPPIFKIPFWKPVSIKMAANVDDIPQTPMIEFMKQSQSGEIAQYQANVENMRDLF